MILQITKGFCLTKITDIVAIILGAGLSTRMGETKLLLPWINTTILGNIVSTLANTGIQDIIVVVHPGHDILFEYIQQLSKDFPIRPVQNESFKPEEMLTSIQYGLKSIKPSSPAAMIALGDQPQIEEETIHQIILTHQQTHASIVVPSFSMRRGHPWLISKSMFSQFSQLQTPQTPRDFFEQHKDEITYVSIDNDSILKDIDTREDYNNLRPII